MDTLRALELRHSVRSYTDQPLSGDVLTTLQKLVKEANKEGGLHIQLVLDRPKAFRGLLAKIGGFKNTKNYFAMIAKKNKGEELGYYGQKSVLEAQKLGLNTCWASGTFGKDADAYDIDRGEKLFAVIAVGYGTTNGNPHKSKSFDDVVKGKDLPDWFTAGANAALQAPTAMNRQPFTLSLGKKDKVVLDKASGLDRGILKYNFEVGAAAKGCKKVDWK